MSTTHVPDPDQSREAARVKRRQELQERFERLADCRTSRDQAVIAAFHDHLASSGLRDCGACGAVLADAAPDPGRPFAAAEAPAVVRYVASAPVEDDAGAAAVALRSLREHRLHLWVLQGGATLRGACPDDGAASSPRRCGEGLTMKVIQSRDKVMLGFGDVTVSAERSSEGAASPVIIWPNGQGPTVIHAPHPHLDEDLTRWALGVLARHVAGLIQR